MAIVDGPFEVERYGAIHIERTRDGWKFAIHNAPDKAGEGPSGMVVSEGFRANSFDEIVDLIKKNVVLD